MNLNDLNKVWEVKPLKKPREDEAREILEKVAKQVQPIMHRRKWKVRILSEFCPPNPALLGLNIGGGSEVKLRLRRPNNEWDFFPYEQILDTMLHELCHNEIGPHNADFYNLLSELRRECEGLMAKGITGTGQGFDLPGRKLGGGGYFRQLPQYSLRQRALSAAEERAKRQALLPNGPKHLGGNGAMKEILTPIQAAAMAAERRLHDDLWCGSKSAEEESPESSGSSRASVDIDNKETSVERDSLVESITEGEMWPCKACSLLNRPFALHCEACGAIKSKGGVEDVKKFKGWSCKFCTLNNIKEKEHCEACGQWRYSYGPPIATLGPYVGT